MKTYSPRYKGATPYAFADSENDDSVRYEIKRKTDGQLACGCMGYVMSKTKPKGCKHIRGLAISIIKGNEAYLREKAQQGEVVLKNLPVPEVLPNVVIEGETFRFRRAIALDGSF